MIISDGPRMEWSNIAELCQLRDMLRYQLIPPVKPVLVKVSTNTFFSSGDRIGVRGSNFESYAAIICGKARLVLDDAPTPAVAGPAGPSSLRGSGLRMKASKVCSTRLPKIRSGSPAGS